MTKKNIAKYSFAKNKFYKKRLADSFIPVSDNSYEEYFMTSSSGQIIYLREFYSRLGNRFHSWETYTFLQFLCSNYPLYFIHSMRSDLKTIFFSCIIQESTLSTGVLGYYTNQNQYLSDLPMFRKMTHTQVSVV